MADNRRHASSSRHRSSSDASAQARRGRCDYCKAEVVFEVFGPQLICPDCGLVCEEEQVFDELAPYRSEQRKRPRTRAQHLAASYDVTPTQRAVDRRDEVQSDPGEALHRRLQRKSYEQQITATLGVLGGYEHLTDDVKELIRRWDAQVNEQIRRSEGDRELGEGSKKHPGGPSVTHLEQLSAAIVAACYALVQQSRKNAPMTTSLEQLCEMRMLGVERVKTLLARLESLGAGSLLDGKTYDKPRDFVDAQIHFLIEQLSLPPRKRSKAGTLMGGTPNEGCSLFNRHEQAYLMRAQPRSDSFSKLVHELAALCAAHGMVNRTALKRNQLDLAACAWAIIMLIIEAQTGQECNEQVMAEAAAWAPGWQSGKITDGFTRGQLGLGKGEQYDKTVEEGYEGVRSASDASLMSHARDRMIRATSWNVRRRYQDIGRVLSVYIRALPWFDEKVGGAAKVKGQTVVQERRDTSNSVITLLPRRVIIYHLRETLQLHTQLQPKVASQFQRGELWCGEDGRSRDDGEEAQGDEQGVDTEASASQESVDGPQPLFRWATFMLRTADNRRRRVGDEISPLAKSIGSTLLSLETLEQMDDATVDRLLFTQGELDTYVCTPEEVSLRRQTQDTAPDNKAGSQLEEVEEVMDDETIEAVIAETLPAVTTASQRRTARRTKAKSQTEFRRILDELMEEDSET